MCEQRYPFHTCKGPFEGTITHPFHCLSVAIHFYTSKSQTCFSDAIKATGCITTLSQANVPHWNLGHVYNLYLPHVYFMKGGMTACLSLLGSTAMINNRVEGLKTSHLLISETRMTSLSCDNFFHNRSSWKLSYDGFFPNLMFSRHAGKQTTPVIW